MFFGLRGGAVGRRFGEQRSVAFGLMPMLAGGLAAALVPSSEAQIAGWVVAGIGEVLLDVLVTKMAIHRFQGPGPALATGIFVNIWPVDIAAALLVLPAIAARVGLEVTSGSIVVLVVLGLLLLATQARPPAGPTAPALPAATR